MLTLSTIKADIGGFVGHSAMHPDLMAEARLHLDKAKSDGLLIDFDIRSCGDDLFLIMTHDRGVGAEPVHHLAWDTFTAGTAVAENRNSTGPARTCWWTPSAATSGERDRDRRRWSLKSAARSRS